MNDEMRKRLEAKAADDAEAADGWELAGCEAGRVARLRRQVADLRTVLAEIDRLRAEIDRLTPPTTLVACDACGRGVRSRYTIGGRCAQCAVELVKTERDAAIRALGRERWEDRRAVATRTGRLMNDDAVVFEAGRRAAGLEPEGR